MAISHKNIDCILIEILIIAIKRENLEIFSDILRFMSMVMSILKKFLITVNENEFVLIN